MRLVSMGTILIAIVFATTGAEHSVARLWNEVLLEAIRNDYARPTVHARNLFHTSIVMYDSWAAYDNNAQTYLLGNDLGGYSCPFSEIVKTDDIETARKEAISYSAYRLLKHRFKNSPGAPEILYDFDSLLISMGYDPEYRSIDYISGHPAALGNYIAYHMIEFGYQDGSNEQDDHSNKYYTSVNPSLVPMKSGNLDIKDPNRWQTLTLDIFIDQSGNVIPGRSIEFLCPEWGNVAPFSLQEKDKTIYTRDSSNYLVWHDPGPPPYLDTLNGMGLTKEYQWTFMLVSIWASHLDPSDSVMWDISPASIGNVLEYPSLIEDFRLFYDLLEGGDPGKGYDLNPKTREPYSPQIVPRGDYTRVLAEFWADGPDSETPPGHWFTILNYVNDHPELEKRWKGLGPILDDLEWDVKTYFTLGGAVHDAAIAAWSIKGWYDYIRPISAIRYMADHGQCSDPTLPNYSPIGIPLVPGFVELVMPGDTLSGLFGANWGKIKLKTWMGHDYVNDPETDVAGVGWILAEEWWPYQRPTFVTPPFAGYVSGHSTYSRAAAEVMTLMTGDKYFPGGMGEFFAEKNKFLQFEEGPSVNISLQWATYQDASDQCSLSRIWGGIHPPIDDIPGRLIGKKIGIEAFNHAEKIMGYPVAKTKKNYKWIKKKIWK